MARTLFEAMLECDRLWADAGPRPQIWQTLDIRKYLATKYESDTNILISAQYIICGCSENVNYKYSYISTRLVFSSLN
jgi:hypothetical protein